MSDLQELYQQVILDHHNRPRNFGDLADADHRAEGYNPLCGDRIHVELKLAEDGTIERAAFTGSGCAICTASASMMTDSLRGKTPEEAVRMFQGFHDLVTGEAGPADPDSALGKLVVFAGVREFPIRVKCATLPWHTFRAALDGEGKPISTE